MLAPIITFLSSSAGGALIGFLQSLAEQKREDKKAKREGRRQEALAHQSHGLAVYEKTIEAAQVRPIRYTYTKTQTRLKEQLNDSTVAGVLGAGSQKCLCLAGC